MHDPVGVDPMRSDQPGSGNCRYCGSGLADLTHSPTAETQRELDVAERSARVAPFWRGLRWLAGALGLCLGVGAAVLCVLSLVFIPLAPAMLWAGIAWLRYAQPGPRRSMPHRWRLAGGGRRHRFGKATTTVPVLTGEALRAPLTGRRCVAYEIGVRTTPKPDAALNQWLLLEQRSAEMELDGVRHGRDTVRLEVERRELAPEDIGMDDASLARFLRERGFSNGDELLLYETVVFEGAECSVANDGLGIARLRSS